MPNDDLPMPDGPPPSESNDADEAVDPAIDNTAATASTSPADPTAPDVFGSGDTAFDNSPADADPVRASVAEAVEQIPTGEPPPYDGPPASDFGGPVLDLTDGASRGSSRPPGPSGGGPSSARLPRVPPSNLSAEQAVLGAMLLSREAIADVVEILEGEHFYKPGHGHIFEAVLGLYGAGEPVDAITVADELERANLLEAVGGNAILIDLQANTPAVSNATYYAKIVEEMALLRRIISVSNEIAEEAYSVPDDVVKSIDDAEAKMFDVAQRRVANSTAEIRDLLSDNLDRLEMLYEQGDAITGTPSGYHDLDELLSGLQKNALYVVGARPAMGKTAFALGMVANAAMQTGKPSMFFCLEMSNLELSQRILCSDARVDATRVKTGRLDENDWSRISHSVGRLAEAPIYIDDNPHTTVMEMRAKARRLKSRVGDLGVIVVDYIQLMTGRSTAESRQVEVSEISRNLKILARELETPVIACAQLNRGLEQRTDKRPMLSDLRESGALEQDADVVMFLYRDEIYNTESEAKGVAEVIVAKHRNGPTATVKLAFLGHFTRFENMSRRTPPAGAGPSTNGGGPPADEF